MSKGMSCRWGFGFMCLLVFGFFENQAFSQNYPIPYVHQAVQRQIQNYEQIYNRSYRENEHIEGLFEILKRGFSYTHSFLEEKKGDFYQANLADLKTYYEFVKIANERKQLTAEAFYLVNNYLGSFCDAARDNEKANLKFFLARTEDTLRKNNKESLLEQLPVVIYSNPAVAVGGPRTAISMETYVDQILHPHGPRWIYQIEANIPDGKTKKVGHYNTNGSTSFFYTHDRIAHSLKFPGKWANEPFKNFILELNTLRLQLKPRNLVKYTFLTNALFFILHEMDGPFKFKQSDSFNVILDSVFRRANFNLQVRGLDRDRNYKVEKRDYEWLLKYRDEQKILRSLNDDQGPILCNKEGQDLMETVEGKKRFSALTSKEKQEHVHLAFERFFPHVRQIVLENYQPGH